MRHLMYLQPLLYLQPRLYLQPAWVRQCTLQLGVACLLLLLCSVGYCYLMARFDGQPASLMQSMLWGLFDWGCWVVLGPILVHEVVRNRGLNLQHHTLLWLALQRTFWLPLLALLIRCLAELWLTSSSAEQIAVLAYKRAPLYLALWLLLLLLVIWRKFNAEQHATHLPQPQQAVKDEQALARAEFPQQAGSLLVYSSKGELWVSLKDVLYLKACGNYMEVKVQDKVYLLRATMKALEQALQHSNLIRCHRSYLVNLNALHSLEYIQSGNHDLLLHNGERLPLSKSCRDSLRVQWQQFKGSEQRQLA